MSTADAVAGVLWLAATFYAIFAGADFGAGIWDLVAGKGERGRLARETITHSIAPVWEANHVWLIFCLVVLWTGFSAAFGAIMSTLFIPLCLVALGIVLRGASFAFRATAGRSVARHVADRLFAVSSLLTPFFMGTVIGAIAAGRVPPGNAQGDPVTSWLNPVSLVTGLLFLATSAYIAAVFLAHDSRRLGTPVMVGYFRARAIWSALAAAAVAAGAMFAYRADAPYVYEGLTGEALPLVVASLLCGLAAAVSILRGATRGVRILAVGAVVSMVWAWAVAQYPYLLPQTLTIEAAAGVEATLEWILVVFGIAVLLVLPSLFLLYTLAQRDLVEEQAEPALMKGGMNHE
jgi:cytochrome d ubiquinol oxidase subunit II